MSYQVLVTFNLANQSGVSDADFMLKNFFSINLAENMIAIFHKHKAAQDDELHFDATWSRINNGIYYAGMQFQDNIRIREISEMALFIDENLNDVSVVLLDEVDNAFVPNSIVVAIKMTNSAFDAKRQMFTFDLNVSVFVYRKVHSYY